MPQDFPLISKDLLDALDTIFPDTLPTLRRSGEERIPSFDLRDIDQASGARMVITRLYVEYAKQNKLGAYQDRHPTGHHSFYKLGGV